MAEVMRQGVVDDVDAITALTRSAYARWVPLIGREPRPMQADYASAITRHRFDLLFAGTELVALIETVLRPEDLLIVNVAVAPTFQKRGYGRKLLAHAEDLAARAGRICVRLYTNARFEENLSLYSSLGYAAEREEVLEVGVVIHMVKRLA
ncbi:GNAT family N-acetyltransferase [Sphingosinicella rhizophila]|uniref:GNAT family N-acetyltransferase n=1 Tax=Sphingosinicella rhizophila TaxID=3050082 RepID=A0ABU3Q9G7_9SPHN|nr:GNAT family N-acetyltransferase [Sphingosinicella sp. GR2756]MDT9600037.1 GNAT family N-acetyltransferase [Sphingosinicella sp. GR2756]